MKYKYKNLKGVILHGIPPGETKTFDHPIRGGGIQLIKEEQTEKKSASVVAADNYEKRYIKKTTQQGE